jgi:hypothetical protein
MGSDYGIRTYGHTRQNDCPHADHAIIKHGDTAIAYHALLSGQMPERKSAAIVSYKFYVRADSHMLSYADQIRLGAEIGNTGKPAVVCHL